MNPRVTALMVMLFCASSNAQQTAPAPSPNSSDAAQAPAIGRLFFTPAQRSALDAERQQAMANALKPKPVVAEAAPDSKPKAPPKPKVVAPQTVTLNGVVRRSDGQTTVWLNSKAVQNTSAAGGLAPGSVEDDSVRIKLGAASTPVQVKVGQSLSTGEREAQEAYKRRRIPKYVAPAERDSSPDLPNGKPSDVPKDAGDAAGDEASDTSNKSAR